MALRIAGDRPPVPPIDPEVPEAPVAPDVPISDPDVGPEVDLGVEPEVKVDPMIAVYRSPDQGPFKCGNCNFFLEEGACQIVAGQIDPEGLCNNFTALDLGGGPEVPTEPGVSAEVPPEGLEAPEEVLTERA